MVRATRSRGKGGKNEHVSAFITPFTRLFSQLHDAKVGVDTYPDANLEVFSESGVEIFLRVSAPRGRTLRLNLTRMTRPELEVFAEMVNAAIDMARPVTSARDAAAQEVEHGNEDEHALRRLFARVPVLLAKEGPVSVDMPELPIRSRSDEEMAGFTYRRVPYEQPAPTGPGDGGAGVDGDLED